MIKELKPCPICGSQAVVIPYDPPPDYPEGGRYGSYYVQCKNCKAHTAVVHVKKNAVSEWNLRHIFWECLRQKGSL